ncbi:MAG: TetR/AcrR family transcriptional regulator [Actinomycetota bacterium]
MATQAERRSTTRAAIVEAASAAFIRHGSPDVSLDEIARDAGVTKGTILYHYESRAGVLAAVAVRLFADLEARVTAGEDVDATSYVTKLLAYQAGPVGRVLFTIGDELMRIGSLGAVDPYRHIRLRLDELSAPGSTAVIAGAVLQFARQLAFGLAEPDDIPAMVAELQLS